MSSLNWSIATERGKSRDDMPTSRPDQFVKLRLSRSAVGQILDALAVAANDWEATYDYLASDRIPDVALVRECSDEHEAVWIANYYRRIISVIESQLTTEQSLDDASG